MCLSQVIVTSGIPVSLVFIAGIHTCNNNNTRERAVRCRRRECIIVNWRHIGGLARRPSQA